MFIMEDERTERQNMLSYGFEQDKDFGCFIKKGLNIIKNYNTVETHTRMGLNLGKENDYAINDVYDFIDKCNECTLEERCQIFYGIRKYYIDKNENIPKSAVTIVSSLRTMIFDEKFSNSKENNKSIKKL